MSRSGLTSSRSRPETGSIETASLPSVSVSDSVPTARASTDVVDQPAATLVR